MVWMTLGLLLGAAGPGFDCGKVASAGIEEFICQDAGLSALDRQLAEVYAAASAKAVNEHPQVLKAEQRGWIKGRDDCWKETDERACIEGEYRRRIAELQARYRLLAPTASVRYACDGSPAKDVVATYFPTEPATLMAEFGDSVSLMFVEPGGSGARYAGPNESLWEHKGVATITWGYGAPPMRCVR